MTITAQSTVSELLSSFNGVRKQLNLEPLSKWGRSKKDLIAKIDEAQKELDAMAPATQAAKGPRKSKSPFPKGTFKSAAPKANDTRGQKWETIDAKFNIDGEKTAVSGGAVFESVRGKYIYIAVVDGKPVPWANRFDDKKNEFVCYGALLAEIAPEVTKGKRVADFQKPE